MERSQKSPISDFLMKSYRDFLWVHGYRFFLRFQGYRLLTISAAKPVAGAFRILTFHDVPKLEHEAFDRLIRYVLEANGFLTPAEAEARLLGEQPPNPNGRIPCLLTFDDGFASNVTVAQEVLSRHGLKAIFFLCPGLIDMSRNRHRQALVRHVYDDSVSEASVPDEVSFMSWDGAEELVRLGHTIGSHTLHHSRLSSLLEEEQRKEIVGSADYLEDKLRVPINWFAYPFGDLGSIDSRCMQIVAERYRFCCSGLRGLNSAETSPVGLLREAIDLTSPFEFQRLVLAGGMDFRHQKRARHLAELLNGIRTA
jgi:peptidoglycan/xylan/chitin deacetylase (PgdA/CDA1 family)